MVAQSSPLARMSARVRSSSLSLRRSISRSSRPATIRLGRTDLSDATAVSAPSSPTTRTSRRLLWWNRARSATLFLAIPTRSRISWVGSSRSKAPRTDRAKKSAMTDWQMSIESKTRRSLGSRIRSQARISVRISGS